MITSPMMMKRIAVSLCLALLAASIPQVRLAVIDFLGATRLLPELTYASGSDRSRNVQPPRNTYKVGADQA